MKCRSCGKAVSLTFADLRISPPSNSFLRPEELEQPEIYYPLDVKICPHCWLAQVDEYKHHSEIFSKDYLYFSSFSSTWLAHSRSYVDRMIQEFKPDANSNWVEIASNDGYLLQYVKAAGIRCLGIEPAQKTALEAWKKGIETVSDFFGVRLAGHLAGEKRHADLLTANNVLAHVPNLHDFLGGFKILLKAEGVATFEFPHLQNLIELNQFDTIYHEHFSYLSISAVVPLLESEGLRAFRVEKLPTHGGSLRLFVCHQESKRPAEATVAQLIHEEEIAGLKNPKVYQSFQRKMEIVKNDLLLWLIEKNRQGKRVCGYGAAAKGNTLLNFAGVGGDLISMVADASPHKQNMFLPGSRIPVVSPEKMSAAKPDAVIVLPWNISQEIAPYLRKTIGPNLEIVVAIPSLRAI